MSNTSQKLIAAALFFSSFILGGTEAADGSYHYLSPQQWDVTSPNNNPCSTSPGGFFGRSAKVSKHK